MGKGYRMIQASQNAATPMRSTRIAPRVSRVVLFIVWCGGSVLVAGCPFAQIALVELDHGRVSDSVRPVKHPHDEFPASCHLVPIRVVERYVAVRVVNNVFGGPKSDVFCAICICDHSVVC